MEAFLTEASVPWWAVSLLELTPRTDQSRVRETAQRGFLGRIKKSPAMQPLWAEVCEAAVKLTEQRSILEWIEFAPERCRFAALESLRAFVQFVGLMDDTMKLPLLKDFQVRAARLLREQMEGLVLLPFGHGKSWISSMLIPLVDWAEDPEFTQGRIYHTERFGKVYAAKLMQEIERNRQMQLLFPWIRKPIRPDPRKGIKGDPCYQFWGTKGFSIGGKQAVEYSFEALTAGGATTGRRYWRTIADDWVNSQNAASQNIQDKYWDYFHTGPKTMGRVVPGWRSHHQSRVGTLGVVGTLFHRQDVNYRLMQEYQREGKPVIRQDVYTDKSCTQSIWPEERPMSYVEEQKRSLGDVAFNMRMRNRVTADDDEHFTDEQVQSAFDRGATWKFGEPPPGWKVLVGFDPAAGKRTRKSKFPAAVALAFFEDHIHVVEWGRWSVPQPGQVDLLADMSHKFGCPVAIEDTSQQISYKYWMEQRYPDVRVISHSTNQNKRDWNQGVESLIPYFRAGNITIHTEGARPNIVNALKDELTSYPQGRYTDLVMAMWVAKYQFELATNGFSGTFRQEPPAAARGRGMYTVIDLKALRARQGSMR